MTPPRLAAPAVRLALAAALAGVAAPAFAQTLPAGADPVAPLLGERLMDLAQVTLKGASLSTAQYREAAALLEAAARVAPTESRFPRLRAEALLTAGDTAGAIKASVAYAKLEPTDQFAQIRLIELYAARIETADGKLVYLRDIAGKTPVPGEVRSFAATLAARVLLERGEDERALASVNDAIRLNPLNPEALQLRWDLSAATATPVERAGALAAMMRANPTRPDAAGMLAEEISRAGLWELSAQWYDLALGLYLKSLTPPPRELLVDYAARLFTIGQLTDAQTLAERILAADPDDTGALLVLLAMEKSAAVTTQPAGPGKALLAARVSYARRVAEIAKAASGPGEVPQLAAFLKTANNEQASYGFEAAVADWAWTELYAGDPRAAGRLVDALALLLGEDDARVARLRGWEFLAANKPDEARVKLTAVAANDPLAALGLVRLDFSNPLPATTAPSTAPAPDLAARALLSANSHGPLGALIWADLRPRGVKMVPGQASEPINAVLATLPPGVVRFAEQPQNYYTVRAETAKVSHEYGEPMLATITLVNTGDLDLTVGRGGAIRPDLWIDAESRGFDPQLFPGSAYDRAAGPLVLRPRQFLRRTVRLDGGTLAAYLRANPTLTVSLFASVCTNPVTRPGSTTRPDGGAGLNDVAPGPGGMRVQFTRIAERGGLAIGRADPRRAMFELAAGTDVSGRIRGIESLAVGAEFLKASAAGDTGDLIGQLSNGVDAAGKDPDPAVRAWAGFLRTLRAPPGEVSATVAPMAADPHWLPRLFALVGARRAGDAPAREIATRLASDPDATVARYAAAVLATLDDAAPTTRP